MLFTLKRILVNPHLSGDSVYFSADLYINGLKAGIVSNDGQGTPTVIDGFDKRGWELIRQAEKFCEIQQPIIMDDLIINGAPHVVKITPAYLVEKIIYWFVGGYQWYVEALLPYPCKN